MAKKSIVRRKRNGVTVVPVIFYAPEPLHAEIKRIVERQGTTQDALLNKWAASNVKCSQAAAEAMERRMGRSVNGVATV